MKQCIHTFMIYLAEFALKPFSTPSRINIFITLIDRLIGKDTPEKALRFLLELDKRLYVLSGRASVRYGNGCHTKHRHIKYHDFFIENTPVGSKVLDVGCGNGALTFDIAGKVSGVSIYGIDKVSTNIEIAREKFHYRNIRYVCGDALSDLPDEKFDVIILSNVLEHIENRIDFMRTLKDRYKPSRFIIRVPLFERDWRVPLKKELGIDYRLDVTHHIEYFQEEFLEEIKHSDLCLGKTEFRWGEIWCVAEPIKVESH